MASKNIYATSTISGYFVTIGFGMCFGLVTSITTSMNLYEYRPEEEVYYQLPIHFGVIIGACLVKFYLKKLGLKIAIQIAAIILMTSGFLLAVFPHPATALISGLLAGTSAGIAIVAQIITTRESSQLSYRRRNFVYISLSFYVGIFLEYFIREFIIFQDYIIGLSVVSVSVLSAVISFRIKESPNFYIYHNNDYQAKKSLMFFRNAKPEEIDAEFHEIKNSIRQKTTARELIHHNLKPFIISLIFIIIKTSAFNIRLIYSFNVFLRDFFNFISDTNITGYESISFGIFGSLIAALFVDRLGHPFLMFLSGFLGAFSLFMIAYTAFSDQGFIETGVLEFPENYYTIVTFILIFELVIGLGFGSLSYLVLGECFTEPMKDLGVAVLILIESFIYILSSLTYTVDNNIFENNHWTLYIISAIFLLIGAFTAIKYLPETPRKRSRQIVEFY